MAIRSADSVQQRGLKLHSPRDKRGKREKSGKCGNYGRRGRWREMRDKREKSSRTPPFPRFSRRGSARKVGAIFWIVVLRDVCSGLGSSATWRYVQRDSQQGRPAVSFNCASLSTERTVASPFSSPVSAPSARPRDGRTWGYTTA
jgi:hypothetical protein